MELYIETLTGAAFELRVSPFETVMSVKAKIQRLEGKQRALCYETKLGLKLGLMTHVKGKKGNHLPRYIFQEQMKKLFIPIKGP